MTRLEFIMKLSQLIVECDGVKRELKNPQGTLEQLAALDVFMKAEKIMRLFENELRPSFDWDLT